MYTVQVIEYRTVEAGKDSLASLSGS